MKKIKLIYNSIAGQSKFKYFLDSIIESFNLNGYDVSIFRVSKKVDLNEYIKNLDKDIHGIVVAGGDGTINKIVNALVKNNIKIPLGIIPAGTSNDFAKHIKMPYNFSKCIDKILAGNIQDVDVGRANDKYFINVCSAGLFTNASQKVDVKLKNSIGKLSYFFAAIYELFKFRPFEVKIETADNIFFEQVSLFLIFNGSSVGGLDKFTDGSNIQDGLLDIVIIKNCKLNEAAVLLYKVLTGKHFQDKNVIYLKEKWLKVTKIKGNVDEPDIDGDEGPGFPLEITCIPNGIKMFL